MSNPEGFCEECERSLILGAVGKWAIHLSQIATAQEVFSPVQADVDSARAMKAAYDEALAQGLGAVTYEGKMIDVAVVRLAQNVIDRAELIAM